MKSDLLVEDPLKLFVRLAVPGIVGMIVIGLYPFMDGIFAGWLIGEQAMSAISVSIPLTLLNSAVAALIGVGSASVLSRAIGQGDRARISQIFGNYIYWVIVFSAVITVVGVVCAPVFLDLIGTSGEIRDLGVRYARIVFLGSLFVNFAQAGNMTMRGEGALKQSMVIMGSGALVNIALDPIFMVAAGEYAIEGAAVATVVSQIFQAVLTYRYFAHSSEFVKVHPVRRSPEVTTPVFSVGISAMLLQLLFALQQGLFFSQAFAYGGEEWGILMSGTMRLYMFAFIPLWGMSQGLQPVIGANFGAGNIDRVRKTMRIFFVGATCLAALSWIPAMVFSEQLLTIFNVSPEILAENGYAFRLFYSVFIVYGLMIMTLTFFQSIGDAKRAGIYVFLRQFVLFVPAIVLLPMAFGPAAVWWAGPLVDAIVILGGVIVQQRILSNLKG
ncbi:Multidrug export protein mepA [Arcanobacterium haemolyticum]|uniref:MATE family efflux transporter n=1 Tax=Arcanobacterium haemolyticum TaxID=28264 RepID=UPI000D8DC491|nr:MATE family efflux transporter [Arcanobacterium haemolyticum]SPT75260.1 Multidrug export protein mepA [Arcanobacterium haemolyticum]